MMNSGRQAAAVAKTHDMSDSDSDATVEPPDYCHSSDGSQDLFDTSNSSKSSRSPSLNKSRQSFTITSSPNSSKPKHNTLLKTVSKTHEVSDSDSDSVDNSKLSKSVAELKHKKKTSLTRTPPKSCSASPAVRLQASKSFTKSSPNSGVSSGASSAHQYTGSARGTNGDTDSSSRASFVASAEELNNSGNSSASKLVCKYGDRCYRSNPDHFQDFSHAGEKRTKRKESPTQSTGHGAAKKPRHAEGSNPSQGPKLHKRPTSDFSKTVADTFSEFQPLSLFLTTVSGIDDRFNRKGAVSLKDILSPLMGNLQASCQFNFMFDIPWVVQQYPAQFRDKPLLLVHGEQGHSETKLKADGSAFPNISFCRAKLEIMYGTHHTKMMFLLYDCGMRVVIHTANMVSNDWHQKTQGVWISPVFPKLLDAVGSSLGKTVRGDSATRFKSDLLAYIAAYHVVPLKQWEQHIHQHDMSSASVHIISSVPGRHSGGQKSAWGHLKLRKVLQEAGPDKKDAGSWPVIGQFSSIGSLGASPDQWLCDEWLNSLSQCRGTMGTPLPHSKLQLVYPSKENVRLCLEGYAGGGCLPYSIKTAKKQIYLNNFVRKWGSEGRGRTEAIPHIKTYTRVSPDYSHAAWFLVTSANLSKAAWGALEKQKTQLMIRSYEIGVLFLPQNFGGCVNFPVARTAEEVCHSKQVMLPVPYDLPPPTYQKGDRIWMWDVPCVDLPDTQGKKYCPRL